MNTTFRRYSINLDALSRERCKKLANEHATTVSGVVRMLIKNGFEALHKISETGEAANPVHNNKN
jgi:hypothetical protein